MCGKVRKYFEVSKRSDQCEGRGGSDVRKPQRVVLMGFGQRWDSGAMPCGVAPLWVCVGVRTCGRKWLKNMRFRSDTHFAGGWCDFTQNGLVSTLTFRRKPLIVNRIFRRGNLKRTLNRFLPRRASLLIPGRPSLAHTPPLSTVQRQLPDQRYEGYHSTYQD